MLYSGLQREDVNRIGAALQESGVVFDVNSEGTQVLVKPTQAAQARMLLAEKGLPRSTSGGYELFDKLGSLGLTSFMQEITRVRAMEGELARTIQLMRGGKAASVHLVLADKGSFRRDQQPASASVVVRTETSGAGNVAQAIRHLVASAVPGLSAEVFSCSLLAHGAVAAGFGASRHLGGKGDTPAPLKDNIYTGSEVRTARMNAVAVEAPMTRLGAPSWGWIARSCDAARAAREMAHAPYSRFAVGAAVLARLARGERVAYVSDAGTPAVSDPGAALVAAVQAAGRRSEAVQGPSRIGRAQSPRRERDRDLRSGVRPERGRRRHGRRVLDLTRPPCR